MPRGPKGEKRPADVIRAAVMVLALYFVWYNFARDKAHKLSPAQWPQALPTSFGRSRHREADRRLRSTPEH